MKLPNSFVLLLSSSTLISCMGVGEDESVAWGDIEGSTADNLDFATERDEEFFYGSGYVWGGSTVGVCWNLADGQYETEKAWVKQAVELSIEEFTGFRVSGWRPCSEGDEDIEISVGNNLWPWARYGSQWFHWGEDMRLNFFDGPPQDVDPSKGGPIDFDGCWSEQASGTAPSTGDTGARTWATNRQRCIEVIAVHEFLHALAVKHEQGSPLNPATSSYCSHGSESGTAYGYWDYVSASNYCNPVWNSDGMLSPLDISGLAHLYGQAVYNDDRMWRGIGDVSDYRSAPGHGFLFKMINYDLEPGYHPIGGDFDGNGKSDIYFLKSGAETDRIYYGRDAGNGFEIHDQTENISGIYTVADFDGDYKDDIIWHTPGSGANQIWFGNSRGVFDKVAATSMPGGYGHKAYAGDFDGDGRGDIFWMGQNSQLEQVWYGRADRTFDIFSYDMSAGSKVLVGDFDGDLKDDLLVERSGSDTVYYSDSSRPSFSSFTVDIPTGAQATVGDLTGNGISDVLFNVTGPSDAIWVFSATRGSYTEVPTSSTLARNGTEALPVAGDYNGDGIGDIFWYSH